MDVIDVAAGLVFLNAKLLITQRKAQTHLAGLWEFPGGKRERNETFEECLKRELKEEIGIEVLVGELVESLTHAYPEKTVRLNFYRCEWRQGELQPLGCADFKWIGREQLPEFQFPPADARLLERLETDLGLWRRPLL